MSCEAACNLILNSNNFYEIEEIAEIDGVEDICEYDATYDRGVVFNILRDDSLPIDEKIKNICKSFNICFSEFSLLDIISRLEFLNANHKILFSQAEKLYWNNILSSELTRILAYFVYRHCSEACDYDEFCESLCYSIFCTGLISALSNENTIEDIARIVSEEVEYSPDNTNFIKSLFY